jgi:hypothetical protein
MMNFKRVRGYARADGGPWRKPNKSSYVADKKIWFL